MRDIGGCPWTIRRDVAKHPTNPNIKELKHVKIKGKL